MKKLTNKVVIITGAGSEIGKAVALKFASEEAKIATQSLSLFMAKMFHTAHFGLFYAR